MDFNTTLSYSAIFISLGAFIISIWDGFETRKNYRLSVTPKVGILGSWIVGSEIIGLLLENKGIGPAILSEIEIIIYGKPFNYLTNSSDTLVSIAAALGEFGTLHFNHFLPEENDMIAVGEKRPFIWLGDENNSDINMVERFRAGFSKTIIKIKYKSIYGKTYSTEYKGDFHSLYVKQFTDDEIDEMRPKSI